jgi:hypothetical protein
MLSRWQRFWAWLTATRHSIKTLPAGTLADTLPEWNRPPAILAGAGISLDNPSNLLAGWDFMEAVITRLMPPEVDRATALSLIAVPKARGYRPGEYIRFETLMGELVQTRIDPDLHVLDCLDECEHPNRNHYILAELIRRGATVMTTNFDRLIEIAYQRTACPGEQALCIVHEDAEFPVEGPSAAKSPTLWKLHGSLSVAGAPTRRSLQATMVQVMWPALRTNKRAFLERVLETDDLLVLGYSGSDDLDLVPTLAEAPSQRALVWVDHEPRDRASGRQPRSAPDIVKNQKALTQYEVVGRERVFFIRGHPGDSPAADPTTVVLMPADTRDVIERLRERFCSDFAPQELSDQYQFGRVSPDAVTRYFDRWIAACAPLPSSRYRLALQLLARRACRRTERALYERLRQQHRRLISAPNATPPERLEDLVEAFNEREHPEPSTMYSRAADSRLLKDLDLLIADLPVELVGTAHRLTGCALWNLSRHDEAVSRFRLAWEVERRLGHLDNELATLTTWQKAAGDFRDHLSFTDHDEANQIAASMGNPTFPDDAFRRIQELSTQTGYQFNLWHHLLDSFESGYVEEDWERKRLILTEAQKMLRAFVDTGDVIQEARARFLLGLCLSDMGERQEATEHLVCLLELGKIIQLGDKAERARQVIEVMGTRHYAAKVRPAFRAAMWI